MLHSKNTSLNLAHAVQSAGNEHGSELSFSELCGSHAIAVADGSDLRLRKWVSAFGHLSAWVLTPEQIEISAQAMIEHGYSPSKVNRDIGTIGSLYKWAKLKRLSPRGFRSPSFGVRRYEEKIRRVHIENEKLDQLRTRSLAVKDRRFGCYVALLIETGARKSEILERKWSEVDFENRQILAPSTKNGTPRILFFSEKTAKLFKTGGSILVANSGSLCVAIQQLGHRG